MLRTIALTLILLLSVGVMLPFANSAHGVRQSAQLRSRRHHRHHSRAWWRRYRARLRQKRAAAALAHKNRSLGVPQNIPIGNQAAKALPTLSDVQALSINNMSAPAPVTNAAYGTMASSGAMAPAAAVTTRALNAPVSAMSTTTTVSAPVVAPVNNSTTVNNSTPVTRPSVKASEARNPARSVSPKLPGQMNLSVVALSRPNPVFLTAREAAKMVGGTSVTDLRRIVIDKMMVSGGWVTNDFIKEVNGSRVFVVTARTPREPNSPEKAWTFYFTEADGRIYGLTLESTMDSADQMAAEAERFLNKLTAQPSNR